MTALILVVVSNGERHRLLNQRVNFRQVSPPKMGAGAQVVPLPKWEREQLPSQLVGEGLGMGLEKRNLLHLSAPKKIITQYEIGI